MNLPVGADAISRRPQLAVGAVVVDDRRLLLIERAHDPGAGKWSLPGGRVEWGETMAAAVERELFEETALVGNCGVPVGWVERISSSYHFVIVDFAVTVAEPSALRAGSDAAAALWVPLADVRRMDLVNGLLTFVTEHGIVPAS